MEAQVDLFEEDERYFWLRVKVAGWLSFGIGLLWPFAFMDGSPKAGDHWMLAMICATGSAGIATSRQMQRSDRDKDLSNPFLVAFIYIFVAQLIGLIGAGVGMVGMAIGAIACEQVICP